jgi:very-short-patch-repair endonuclease
VADPSEFEARLQVVGEERHGYRILRMESSAVPNAIAAVLLHIRDLTGARPHVFSTGRRATRWRTCCAS